jgi:hypothetical protein
MKKFQSIIFFNLLIGTQSGNFGTQNMKNWDPKRQTWDLNRKIVGTQKFFIQSKMVLKLVVTMIYLKKTIKVS